MSAVDNYLRNVTESQRAEFERVRKAVKEVIPEAEETMSYGMPAFKYHKRILIYFGAFKNHFSLFPASDEMIAVVGEQLAVFRSSKGTLQFSEDRPLSEQLLKKIIQYRLDSVMTHRKP